MPHYWTFPNEGMRLLPEAVEQTDLTIRQFLNDSVKFPPTGGFGLVAPYAGDVIKVVWPADDYLSLQRSWHCMPCQQQKSLHNQSHEEFDWNSCSYDESPPRIYSMTLDINPLVKYRPSIHTSIFKLAWPYPIEASTMLCALNVPGAFPKGLSTAFPFINAARPATRGQHTFALDAPTGRPTEVLKDLQIQGKIALDKLAWILLLAVLVAWIIAGRRYFLSKTADVVRQGWARARKEGFWIRRR